MPPPSGTPFQLTSTRPDAFPFSRISVTTGEIEPETSGSFASAACARSTRCCDALTCAWNDATVAWSAVSCA